MIIPTSIPNFIKSRTSNNNDTIRLLKEITKKGNP